MASSTSGRTLFWPWALYALLAVAVTAPVLSVTVPVLGDTLNHLARIHILAAYAASPALQRFYAPDIRPVPYFGMDAPVWALCRIMGLLAAGRLYLALCVLMPPAAAAALHAALYRRVGLVPVLGFLLSYNYLLARGFLPYLFSAGLAILLFALWIATARWAAWRRLALFAPAATLIYLGHAFAFAAYGILLGGYELGRLVTARSARAEWASVAAALGQAVPALMLAVLFRAQATFGTGTHVHYGSLPGKLAALLSPVFFPGHVYVVGLFALVPLAALALAARARIARGMWPAIAPLAAAAVATPSVLLNVWGADFRLPLVLAVVVIGAASAPALGRRARMAVLAIATVLTLARAADAFMLLHALDAQAGAVRGVLALLPPGQRLLVVDATPEGAARIAPYYVTGHLAMLAAIDRDAFVPFLFTGTTPVQVRPGYANAGSPSAEPVTPAQLLDGFAHADPPGGPPAYGYGGHVYWLGWTQKFDALLVLHDGAAPPAFVPGRLHLIGRSAHADLYQILR